jgi:hypothetical protein
MNDSTQAVPNEPALDDGDLTKLLDDWPLDDFQSWKGCFQPFAPPPTMDVAPWADTFRVIAPEFANQPGRWRTARAAYMREPMISLSP